MEKLSKTLSVETPDITSLDSLYKNLTILKDGCIYLSISEDTQKRLSTQIISQESDICQCGIELQEIEKEIGVCPTCGKPFDVH